LYWNECESPLIELFSLLSDVSNDLNQSKLERLEGYKGKTAELLANEMEQIIMRAENGTEKV